MGVIGVAIANTSSVIFNILVQQVLIRYVFSSDFDGLFKFIQKQDLKCENCKNLVKSTLGRIMQNLLEFWTIPLMVILTLK